MDSSLQILPHRSAARSRSRASTTASPALLESSSAVRQPDSATADSVASNISGLVSSAEIWNETEKEIEIKVKM